MKSPPDLLMSKRNESHPTERADLFRKRLVVAIETESGRRLNETLAKELTGGDRIRARRMREDFWEFEPSHKIVLATNHKPAINGTDKGIWRRIQMIPFEVEMSDKKAVLDMPDKLRAEYAGILAWCVRGTMAWQSCGLKPPESVGAATRQYKLEEDRLGAFLDECTERGDDFKVQARHLYERYCDYMQHDKDKLISETAFSSRMFELGFEKEKDKTTRCMCYLAVRIQTEGPSEEFNTLRPTPVGLPTSCQKASGPSGETSFSGGSGGLGGFFHINPIMSATSPFNLQMIPYPPEKRELFVLSPLSPCTYTTYTNPLGDPPVPEGIPSGFRLRGVGNRDRSTHGLVMTGA